jgi:hypothetical protein
VSAAAIDVCCDGDMRNADGCCVRSGGDDTFVAVAVVVVVLVVAFAAVVAKRFRLDVVLNEMVLTLFGWRGFCCSLFFILILILILILIISIIIIIIIIIFIFSSCGFS